MSEQANDQVTSLAMTSEQWLGALAHAWWLGHRDVCNDCNCPERLNPYSRTAPDERTPDADA